MNSVTTDRKAVAMATALSLVWLSSVAVKAAEPAGRGNAAGLSADVAARVLALTGAETRIVWLRNKHWQTGKGGVDGGAGCALMALDTAGKGERELAPEGELYNPLIAPGGGRVVFTAKTDGKLRIQCVDWNGENRRVLGDGYGLWTWRDPATGIDWVYASDAAGNSATFVDRFRFDEPTTRERVYSNSLANRFSLSADGTRAVAEFPHPHTAMLFIRTGQLDCKNYRTGCNTYISPDDSYFVTIMDGGHSLVTLYRPDGSSGDVGVIPPGMKPKMDGRPGCVWNPKWASDARHLSVVGPLKNLGPDRADVWLGRFAEDFRSIAEWVQVTDNDFLDCSAYVWVDPGLGRHAGEAPYTLTVPPEVTGAGDWRWTFGDGAAGSQGRHTYAKAGTYAITARQGDRSLEGTVRVAERTAPKLLSTVALDDRRVLLTCSEPVDVMAARVRRRDGNAATKLSLDSEGSGIIAEFAAPLAAQESLAVTGVTDRAQTPNGMAAETVQFVRPAWPSNRAGLCHLWKNARTRNVIIDERVGLPVSAALIGFSNHQLSVPARFDRFGAALAVGGGFVPSRGTPERVMAGIKQTHQFSLEMLLASADLAQTKGGDDKPLAVVNWGYAWRNGIFWLFQEKDTLLVGLSKTWGDKNPAVFEMATLPDTKSHHLIVSYAPKRLACYLDGRKMKEIDPAPAQLVELSPPMSFAACIPDPHKNIWRGTFEYVAMYNRFIDEPEAAQNAAAVAADRAARKTLPKITVQSTLVAQSTLPQPGNIAPYRNALVVSEYRVDQVLEGTYAPQTIRVAQWGLIDLQPTALASRKPGTSVKMVLERFSDHDELATELISDTLEENFDLDLYTDVNP